MTWLQIDCLIKAHNRYEKMIEQKSKHAESTNRLRNKIRHGR